MRIVCADAEPQYRELLDERQLERLRASGHEFLWLEGPPADEAGWVERLEGADAVLLFWRLPAGVLSRCRSVRAVSFGGTGVESFVPMEEAGRLEVAVCNVPSYGANAVAEHAFALALAVARRVAVGDRLVRSGAWGPGHTSGVELRGRRLGVVGAGAIGTRAVEIGLALGMEPVAWTRAPTAERAARLGAPFVPLEELFATSALVTLHLAHTPETEQIVDRDLLGLLGPDAILVNTARGQLVDNVALVELLEREAFFGAGIDAFEEEPLPADHPLLACERVVLTPHVGFNTPDASAEILRMAIENLLAFAAGTPQNVVPPAA